MLLRCQPTASLNRGGGEVFAVGISARLQLGPAALRDVGNMVIELQVSRAAHLRSSRPSPYHRKGVRGYLPVPQSSPAHRIIEPFDSSIPTEDRAFYVAHKALGMNPCQPEEVSCSAARTGSLDGLEGSFLFSLQFQRNAVLWRTPRTPGRLCGAKTTGSHFETVISVDLECLIQIQSHLEVR